MMRKNCSTTKIATKSKSLSSNEVYISSEPACKESIQSLIEEVSSYYLGRISYEVLSESMLSLQSFALKKDYLSSAKSRLLSIIKFKTDNLLEIPENLLLEALSYSTSSDKRTYGLRLEQRYFEHAYKITVKSLLKLTELKASELTSKLAEAVVSVFRKIEDISETDDLEVFKEYLQRPGHFLQLLRKIPKYIQIRQISEIPVLCEEIENVIGKDFFEVFKVAYEMNTLYESSVKPSFIPLSTSPKTRDFNPVNVPRYANGVGFSITSNSSASSAQLNTTVKKEKLAKSVNFMNSFRTPKSSVNTNSLSRIDTRINLRSPKKTNYTPAAKTDARELVKKSPRRITSTNSSTKIGIRNNFKSPLKTPLNNSEPKRNSISPRKIESKSNNSKSISNIPSTVTKHHLKKNEKNTLRSSIKVSHRISPGMNLQRKTQLLAQSVMKKHMKNK